MSIDPRPIGLTLTDQLETLGHLDRRERGVGCEMERDQLEYIKFSKGRPGRTQTEKTRRIVQLTKDGKHIKEIMELLGATRASVEAAQLKARNKGELPSRSKARDAKIAAAVQMNNVGVHPDKIAVCLSITRRYVDTLLYKARCNGEYVKKQEYEVVRDIKPESIEYVRRYKAGERIVDIAIRAGVSRGVVESAIIRARKRGELPKIDNTDRDKQIIELYNGGTKIAQIAKRLDMNFNTTKTVLHKYRKNRGEG